MFKLQSNQKLLTRAQFKVDVFQRDNHTCVFCDKKATSANHIMDRKLFSDGGYYLDNGVSVCDEHRWKCDTTDLSVENIWEACKITNKILPVGFDPKRSYDKWANLIFEDGTRSPGAMFRFENVQNALKDKLHLFEKMLK
jgi:hypothetical protein